MNLLQKIINKKLKEYQEPSREGTPKGEPIGFQRDKYAAALYCLTGLSKREIADKADCNYNSLLAWRSREDFKNQVRENAVEVAEILVDGLVEANKNAFVDTKEKFPGEFPDAYFFMLMSPRDDRQIVKDYGKISYYAPFMVIAILNALTKRLREFGNITDLSGAANTTEFLMMLYTARNIMTWIWPGIEKKKDMKDVASAFATLNQLIDNILAEYVLAGRVFPVLEKHNPKEFELLQAFLSYHGIIELVEGEPQPT